MSYTMRPSDVLLKNVRLSYVRFDKAISRNAGQEPKYSCTILVPKTDVAQKQAIDNAIAAAIAVGREKFGNAVPAKPKTVIWDGDGYTQSGKEFGPEAKGHWVFTASLAEARGPVQVVDLNRNPILRQTEIYSGMYANVLVNFFFYKNETVGVGAGLGPVQKVADGEPLGGTLPSADDVFGAPDVAQPVAGQPYAQPTPGTYAPQSAPPAPATYAQPYAQPAAYAAPAPAAYAAPAPAAYAAPPQVNPLTGAPM